MANKYKRAGNLYPAVALEPDTYNKIVQDLESLRRLIRTNIDRIHRSVIHAINIDAADITAGVAVRIVEDNGTLWTPGDANVFATQHHIPVQVPVREEDNMGLWGIAAIPAPQSAVLELITHGPVTTKINIPSDRAGAKYADINASGQIEADAGGWARILWKETSTGSDVLAVLMMGDHQKMFSGTLPANVTAGSTTTVTTEFGFVRDGILHDLSTVNLSAGMQVVVMWLAHDRKWHIVPAALSTTPGGSDSGQFVRIKSLTGTPATCDDINQEASCVWGGVVVSMSGSPNLCGDPWTEGASIWVAESTRCNKPTSLKFNEVYLARRSLDSYTPAGQAAGPLYVIRSQTTSVDCQAFADLDPATNPLSEDIRIPVLVDTYASPGDPEPESTDCKTIDICDLRPRRVEIIEASGIGHGATGTVELANDSSVTFEVLNSDCGFLIPGLKALAVPACGASDWIIAPMPIEYLGVTNVNIDADASGSVTIYDKTGTATAFSITAFNRFTHGGYDIVSGEKVRVKWMFANAEFVIDVVECLVE